MLLGIWKLQGACYFKHSQLSKQKILKETCVSFKMQLVFFYQYIGHTQGFEISFKIAGYSNIYFLH